MDVDRIMVEKHQKSLDALNKIFSNPAFKCIHPLKQAFFLRMFNEHTAEIIKRVGLEKEFKQHKRNNMDKYKRITDKILELFNNVEESQKTRRYFLKASYVAKERVSYNIKRRQRLMKIYSDQKRYK